MDSEVGQLQELYQISKPSNPTLHLYRNFNRSTRQQWRNKCI